MQRAHTGHSASLQDAMSIYQDAGTSITRVVFSTSLWTLSNDGDRSATCETVGISDHSQSVLMGLTHPMTLAP